MELFVKHWYILLWFTILVNSFLPQEFQKFINEAVEKSERHFANKRVMKVDATPEFVHLFKNSTLVASKIIFIWWKLGKKGRFHHLVSNFRKRRFHQIEQDNCKEEFKELKKKSSEDYRTIMNLKEKLTDFQDKHFRKWE